jgi:hypothetical protein
MAILVAIFGLFGCSSNPVINGMVLDIWNNPINGASIKVDGIEEEQISDANGEFKFVLEDYENHEVRLRAAKVKFIHDVEILAFDTEEEMSAITFHLYPEPEERGFYAIGESKYLPLKEQPTTKVATKLEAYHGINDIGSVRLQGLKKKKFVLYSTLRKEQLRQIDLLLNQLEFKEEEEMKGVLGETAVEIDLWLAKRKKYPFSVRALGQDYMYLIEFKEDLDKGVYAFHSGKFLTKADPRRNDARPEELQVAYPFEVK